MKGGDDGGHAARGPLEKGFNFRDARIDHGNWRWEENAETLENFFRLLAICHTVGANNQAKQQSGFGLIPLFLSLVSILCATLSCPAPGRRR